MSHKPVLLVEDDEDLGMIVSFALKAAGYPVQWVKDGIQAMQSAKTFAPGVIISDFMFPGGGGANLHQRLRQTLHSQNIPILVLTAVPRELVTVSITLDSNTYYLEKPFKKAEFLEIVGLLEQGLPHEPSRLVPSAAAAEGAAADDGTPSHAKATVKLPTATVLVVDGNKDDCRLIRLSFEKEGYELVEAADGAEAADLLALGPDAANVTALRPDLIVMDVQLPKIDGYTLFTRLRENLDTDRIPVIVLTAKAGMREMFGRDLRGFAFLSKPIEPQTLRKSAADLLASRPERR
jgi:CheY-like chemotaxis protein